MTKNDDDGAAFPVSGNYIWPGMTLRDWFAGQALAGTLANPGVMSAKEWATQAYEIADAMLAARKEPKA